MAKPTDLAATNPWTLADSIHDGEIDPWANRHETIAPPSIEEQHATRQALASIAQIDGLIARLREKLFPKPWSIKIGGGANQGIGYLTAGAALIQPARCLLDVIHNPSTTTPSTVAIGELDGDPIPKFQTTIPAGGTVTIPGGLLFNHGITLLGNTGNLPLTFGGRTLD
jgi:hypothetical protein